MYYLALLGFAAAKKIGTPRLKGVLRVAGYTTGISLVMGAFCVHKARADLNEKGMQFGENMASIAGLIQDSHTFRLNNQEVHTSVASTLDGVTTVLDKYEANCQAALGGQAPVWDQIPKITKEPAPASMKLSMAPILRQESSHKGMVVCFIPNDPKAPHSERSLQLALHEFEETGNLSAIGKFRYAFVKEGPTGSTVITVWADGDFNLKALVPPKDGSDTPGADPTVMTRPANGSRIFTGTIDGMGYRVYGYRTTDTPAQAIAAYDAKMEQAGWLSVKNPIFEGMPHEGNEGRSYINPDKGLAGVVSATLSPDGKTMIGVAEVTDGTIHSPTQTAKEADGF